MFNGAKKMFLSMYGTTPFVRSLSEQEQAWFIRAIGRNLSLKTLTRNRLTSDCNFKTSGRGYFNGKIKLYLLWSVFKVDKPKLLYNTHVYLKRLF